MDTWVANTRAAQHQRIYAHSMFLLLAAFVALVPPCAATMASPTCPELKRAAGAVSHLLAEGNAALETGDIAKAQTSWKTIRECAPASQDWPKAVFNLGLLEYKRDNLRQAIKYFDEVLQSHPNDKEPGANLMETNRNYSYRSALAISQCYETMGSFGSALRYAWLAKTKYTYYSWCGTCYDSASFALNKRIAYLTVRSSRLHIWASTLLLGILAIRWKRSRS